jgi:2-methylisocitrate lyase-like PEP mutase family enzyme
MDNPNLDNNAETLRALHRPTLVLPNAWDVASARIFEESGFPAIGTTSAGIAFTLGYPDGEKLARGEMIEVVARIARAVKIPVTADVEAGYGDAVETARAVWAAGAVGMNLEDTAGSNDLLDLPSMIREIRRATPKMLLNARTDIFLNQIGEEATRFDRAVERLNAYRDAGADCLFAPGVRDAATIEKLVKVLKGPLNILAVAGTPPVPELKSLGVARVSIGSGAMRATLGLTDRIARELRDHGTFRSLVEGAIPYPQVNQLLGRR